MKESWGQNLQNTGDRGEKCGGLPGSYAGNAGGRRESGEIVCNLSASGTVFSSLATAIVLAQGGKMVLEDLMMIGTLSAFSSYAVGILSQFSSWREISQRLFLLRQILSGSWDFWNRNRR